MRKLFSKEQRAFYAAHVDGIALDDLSSSGRSSCSSCRFTPKELGRTVVAEMWLYPDGSRILELSTRALTSEAFQVAAELRAFLGDRGIDISGDAGDEDAQGARVLRASGVTAEAGVVIVPRWEWRTFGDDFGAADAASPPSRPSGSRTATRSTCSRLGATPR